jgi:hypothetical protein
MASSKNRKKTDVIVRTLKQTISDLGTGPSILTGKLTLSSGHDYFYFLEFGTGPFHEAPGESMIDAALAERQIEIAVPPSVAAHQPGGAAYDITAKNRPLLVYKTKDGAIRRRLSTIHPGIQPMGFVRSAIFDAEIYLEKDLETVRIRVANGGKLPMREELINIVNYTLEVLLGQLRLHTPVDRDNNDFHTDRPHSPTLTEAWGIEKVEVK